MTKNLVRLIALFVVPCLVADPNLASALSQQPLYSSLGNHGLQSIFSEEAFELPLVAERGETLEQPQRSQEIQRTAAALENSAKSESGLQQVLGLIGPYLRKNTDKEAYRILVGHQNGEIGVKAWPLLAALLRFPIAAYHLGIILRVLAKLKRISKPPTVVMHSPGFYRRFGKSKFTFFVMGLGAIWSGRRWPPGNQAWKRPSDAEFEGHLLEGFERMVNRDGALHIDTSASYGGMEARLQAFFAKYPELRGKAFLATKWGEIYDPTTESSHLDYSLANLQTSVANSYARLGRIDLLYVHMPSPATIDVLRDSSVLNAMQAMIKKRQVRMLGVSISKDTLLEQAINEELLNPFDVVQMPADVFLNRPDLVERIHHDGKAIVVNSPIRNIKIPEGASEKKIQELYRQRFQQLLDAPNLSLILNGSETHFGQNIGYVLSFVKPALPPADAADATSWHDFRFLDAQGNELVHDRLMGVSLHLTRSQKWIASGSVKRDPGPGIKILLFRQEGANTLRQVVSVQDPEQPSGPPINIDGKIASVSDAWMALDMGMGKGAILKIPDDPDGIYQPLDIFQDGDGKKWQLLSFHQELNVLDKNVDRITETTPEGGLVAAVRVKPLKPENLPADHLLESVYEPLKGLGKILEDSALLLVDNPDKPPVLVTTAVHPVRGEVRFGKIYQIKTQQNGRFWVWAHVNKKDVILRRKDFNSPLWIIDQVQNFAGEAVPLEDLVIDIAVHPPDGMAVSAQIQGRKAILVQQGTAEGDPVNQLREIQILDEKNQPIELAEVESPISQLSFNRSDGRLIATVSLKGRTGKFKLEQKVPGSSEPLRIVLEPTPAPAGSLSLPSSFRVGLLKLRKAQQKAALKGRPDAWMPEEFIDPTTHAPRRDAYALSDIEAPVVHGYLTVSEKRWIQLNVAPGRVVEYLYSTFFPERFLRAHFTKGMSISDQNGLRQNLNKLREPLEKYLIWFVALMWVAEGIVMTVIKRGYFPQLFIHGHQDWAPALNLILLILASGVVASLVSLFVGYFLSRKTHYRVNFEDGRHALTLPDEPPAPANSEPPTSTPEAAMHFTSVWALRFLAAIQDVGLREWPAIKNVSGEGPAEFKSFKEAKAFLESRPRAVVAFRYPFEYSKFSEVNEEAGTDEWIRQLRDSVQSIKTIYIEEPPPNSWNVRESMGLRLVIGEVSEFVAAFEELENMGLSVKDVKDVPDSDRHYLRQEIVQRFGDKLDAAMIRDVATRELPVPTDATKTIKDLLGENIILEVKPGIILEKSNDFYTVQAQCGLQGKHPWKFWLSLSMDAFNKVAPSVEGMQITLQNLTDPAQKPMKIAFKITTAEWAVSKKKEEYIMPLRFDNLIYGDKYRLIIEPPAPAPEKEDSTKKLTAIPVLDAKGKLQQGYVGPAAVYDLPIYPRSKTIPWALKQFQHWLDHWGIYRGLTYDQFIDLDHAFFAKTGIRIEVDLPPNFADHRYVVRKDRKTNKDVAYAEEEDPEYRFVVLRRAGLERGKRQQWVPQDGGSLGVTESNQVADLLYQGVSAHLWDSSHPRNRLLEVLERYVSITIEKRPNAFEEQVVFGEGPKGSLTLRATIFLDPSLFESGMETRLKGALFEAGGWLVNSMFTEQETLTARTWISLLRKIQLPDFLSAYGDLKIGHFGSSRKVQNLREVFKRILRDLELTEVNFIEIVQSKIVQSNRTFFNDLVDLFENMVHSYLIRLDKEFSGARRENMHLMPVPSTPSTDMLQGSYFGLSSRAAQHKAMSFFIEKGRVSQVPIRITAREFAELNKSLSPEQAHTILQKLEKNDLLGIKNRRANKGVKRPRGNADSDLYELSDWLSQGLKRCPALGNLLLETKEWSEDAISTIRFIATIPDPGLFTAAYKPIDPVEVSEIAEVREMDVMQAWQLTGNGSIQNILLTNPAFIGLDKIKLLKDGKLAVKIPYRLKVKIAGSIGGRSFFDVTDHREFMLREGDKLFLVSEAPPSNANNLREAYPVPQPTLQNPESPQLRKAEQSAA